MALTRHKHADIIHAWAEGKKIESLDVDEWNLCTKPYFHEDTQYRIKPEPVEDIVLYSFAGQSSTDRDYAFVSSASSLKPDCNVKFTFDSFTLNLKSVELIKCLLLNQNQQSK